MCNAAINACALQQLWQRALDLLARAEGLCGAETWRMAAFRV